MTNQEFDKLVALENQAKSNANSAQRWQERAYELEKELEQLKGEQYD